MEKEAELGCRLEPFNMRREFREGGYDEETGKDVDDAFKIGTRRADEISKGFALEETRRLLYDLNKRSQFADATRLMFPFVEVYKEVLI